MKQCLLGIFETKNKTKKRKKKKKDNGKVRSKESYDK